MSSVEILRVIGPQKLSSTLALYLRAIVFVGLIALVVALFCSASTVMIITPFLAGLYVLAQLWSVQMRKFLMRPGRPRATGRDKHEWHLMSMHTRFEDEIFARETIHLTHKRRIAFWRILLLALVLWCLVGAGVLLRTHEILSGLIIGTTLAVIIVLIFIRRFYDGSFLGALITIIFSLTVDDEIATNNKKMRDRL